MSQDACDDDPGPDRRSGGRTRAQRHTRPGACQVTCVDLDEMKAVCRLEVGSRFAYRCLPTLDVASVAASDAFEQDP